MKEIHTNDGKRGGWLVGKKHYSKIGEPLGGIKAIVKDTGKIVELEGGETIITAEASKKHWKELSKINQDGGGVAIGPPNEPYDEDPEEYSSGGTIIDFNPNHTPSKKIINYAKNLKSKHPEIWSVAGNIFGNQAFENLCKVSKRGYWLDSEKWMYIKWQSYIARHKQDFQLKGVVAMLKWADKINKGFDYMKSVIEYKISNSNHKPKMAKTKKLKDGGIVNNSKPFTCEIFDKDGVRKIDKESIEKVTLCTSELEQTKTFHIDDDGNYTPARKALHKEIIGHFKKHVTCITDGKPIAILLGGSPASGKSTFLKKFRPYLLSNSIYKVDADEVRAMLPEYKGWNANSTQQETGDIVNTLISDRSVGVPCKFDFIYDGTMTNLKKYKALINMLKEQGYEVFVIFMEPIEKSIIVKRAMERYRKTGRFVPEFVIDEFYEKGEKNLQELKDMVDGYIVVNSKNYDYSISESGGKDLPNERIYSKLGYKLKMKTGGKIPTPNGYYWKYKKSLEDHKFKTSEYFKNTKSALDYILSTPIEQAVLCDCNNEICYIYNKEKFKDGGTISAQDDLSLSIKAFMENYFIKAVEFSENQLVINKLEQFKTDSIEDKEQKSIISSAIENYKKSV